MMMMMMMMIVVSKDIMMPMAVVVMDGYPLSDSTVTIAAVDMYYLIPPPPLCQVEFTSSVGVKKIPLAGHIIGTEYRMERLWAIQGAFVVFETLNATTRRNKEEGYSIYEPVRRRRSIFYYSMITDTQEVY